MNLAQRIELDGRTKEAWRNRGKMPFLQLLRSLRRSGTLSGCAL